MDKISLQYIRCAFFKQICHLLMGINVGVKSTYCLLFGYCKVQLVVFSYLDIQAGCLICIHTSSILHIIQERAFAIIQSFSQSLGYPIVKKKKKMWKGNSIYTVVIHVYKDIYIYSVEYTLILRFLDDKNESSKTLIKMFIFTQVYYSSS